MVHCMCDKVTFIDLLMPQSSHDQLENQWIFQIGASEC